MAGRKETAISVDVFPFLSVLACVMGVLTLIIAGMALGQVTQASLGGKEEMIRTQQLVAQALFVQSMMLLSTDQSNPRHRVTQLKGELDALQRELERLRELLKGVVMPDDAMIKLTPGGTGTDLDATFVDCTEFAIVLHPERTTVGEVPGEEQSILSNFERLVRIHRQTQRIRKQDIKDSQAYRAFLRDVEDRRRGTMIFLIRPDGVDCFAEARAVANKFGIRYGYLPIPGHGSIDFSQFRIGQ